MESKAQRAIAEFERARRLIDEADNEYQKAEKPLTAEKLNKIKSLYMIVLSSSPQRVKECTYLTEVIDGLTPPKGQTKIDFFIQELAKTMEEEKQLGDVAVKINQLMLDKQQAKQEIKQENQHALASQFFTPANEYYKKAEGLKGQEDKKQRISDLHDDALTNYLRAIACDPACESKCTYLIEVVNKICRDDQTRLNKDTLLQSIFNVLSENIGKKQELILHCLRNTTVLGNFFWEEKETEVKGFFSKAKSLVDPGPRLRSGTLGKLRDYYIETFKNDKQALKTLENVEKEIKAELKQQAYQAKQSVKKQETKAKTDQAELQKLEHSQRQSKESPSSSPRPKK